VDLTRLDHFIPPTSDALFNTVYSTVSERLLDRSQGWHAGTL
jgi:hypothetical protein